MSHGKISNKENYMIELFSCIDNAVFKLKMSKSLRKN